METYPSVLLVDSFDAALSPFHNRSYDRFLQRQLWFTQNSGFMIRAFKARKCVNSSRCHNWASCPYVHLGESVQRRNPYEYPYKRQMCRYTVNFTDCPRGNKCKFCHGVYEYWLHPTRYRTRMCNQGLACRRSVCFFAHSSRQLRMVPPPPHTPNYYNRTRAAAQRRRLLRENAPNYVVTSRETGATSTGTTTSLQRRPDDQGSGINQVAMMNWYLEMLKDLLDQLDYITF